MNASGLDIVQTGNGARQLAFKSPAIARGLHELAGTEPLLLVENLETDVAVGRRNTGTGQPQARASQIIGLDQQGTGVGFDGVGNIGRGEGIHHLAGIHPSETAEQRPIIRLLRPEHHTETDSDAGGQTDQ